MSERTKKPTKKMQINYLEELVDKYHTGMYHLMQYMEAYGLVMHYQQWVEGSATDKDLPNKLIVSELKMEKPINDEVDKTDNKTTEE